MDPEISAVIPTYNEEKFVEKCLSSIKNQTVKPSEIIVVDGGSTDRTVEIAEYYAKIIHSPYRSISFQRELGCNEAKGDFILSADADTVFPSNWIEKALENFHDSEVVAVTSDMTPLNPNPITILNCWFRNLVTPQFTQRAACFLFKNPKTENLFNVNGYISKQDITPLKKRLKGKIIKDSSLTVLTDIPADQQLQTVLILLGIGGATATAGYLIAKHK